MILSSYFLCMYEFFFPHSWWLPKDFHVRLLLLAFMILRLKHASNVGILIRDFIVWVDLQVISNMLLLLCVCMCVCFKSYLYNVVSRDCLSNLQSNVFSDYRNGEKPPALLRYGCLH